MLLIEAKIPKENARKLLHKRRFLWQEKEHRIEMVFLPYFHLNFSISEDNQTKEIHILCDGISGVVTLFGDTKGISFVKFTKTTLMPFVLTTEQAEMDARETISRWMLQQSVRTPTKGDHNLQLQSHRQLAFPYWVLYFSRRGKYDFRVIDAVSGNKIGIKLRRSFIQAFISR